MMVQNKDMRKGTNHLVANLCIVWNDVSLIRVLRKMYNKREFLLTRPFFCTPLPFPPFVALQLFALGTHGATVKGCLFASGKPLNECMTEEGRTRVVLIPERKIDCWSGLQLMTLITSVFATQIELSSCCREANPISIFPCLLTILGFLTGQLTL